jgi:hypothetical protein
MADEQRLIPGTEAAWLDEERARRSEARRVAFWEVLHRLADEYGVEVVLTPKRSAARWDERYDPPRLVAATVRFERAGLPRRRRAPRTLPPAPSVDGEPPGTRTHGA